MKTYRKITTSRTNSIRLGYCLHMGILGGMLATIIAIILG